MALIARVRWMMLIAGLTTALAVGAVLIAIGYRLFHGGGSVATTTDLTAVLPKGAKVAQEGVAGEPHVGTLEIAAIKHNKE